MYAWRDHSTVQREHVKATCMWVTHHPGPSAPLQPPAATPPTPRSFEALLEARPRKNYGLSVRARGFWGVLSCHRRTFVPKHLYAWQHTRGENVLVALRCSLLDCLWPLQIHTWNCFCLAFAGIHGEKTCLGQPYFWQHARGNIFGPWHRYFGQHTRGNMFWALAMHPEIVSFGPRRALCTMKRCAAIILARALRAARRRVLHAACRACRERFVQLPLSRARCAGLRVQAVLPRALRAALRVES